MFISYFELIVLLLLVASFFPLKHQYVYIWINAIQQLLMCKKSFLLFSIKLSCFNQLVFLVVLSYFPLKHQYGHIFIFYSTILMSFLSIYLSSFLWNEIVLNQLYIFQGLHHFSFWILKMYKSLFPVFCYISNCK